MNPELQNYIQDALKAGSRPEDIDKALVDAGWETREVNLAIRKFGINSKQRHRFPLDLGILILNIILALVIQGILAPTFDGNSNGYLIRVWVVATAWVSLFFCTFITIFLYTVSRNAPNNLGLVNRITAGDQLRRLDGPRHFDRTAALLHGQTGILALLQQPFHPMVVASCRCANYSEFSSHIPPLLFLYARVGGQARCPVG